MGLNNKVNVLLVDDQPARLLTYESILGELGQNLVRAGSGLEAGASDYLAKPVNIEQLLSALRMWLHR